MNPSKKTGIFLVHLSLACIVMPVAMAADDADEPTLVPSKDGAYVINLRTRLAWPRCVEGMSWDGDTCVGKPLLVDHAGAVALVQTRQKAEGGRWRLPHVTDWQQLIGKPAGLDPQLFPAAPADWYWTDTANVKTARVNPYSYGNAMHGRTTENTSYVAFLHAWAVNSATGEARGDVAKRTKLPVRLVRQLKQPG